MNRRTLLKTLPAVAGAMILGVQEQAQAASDSQVLWSGLAPQPWYLEQQIQWLVDNGGNRFNGLTVDRLFSDSNITCQAVDSVGWLISFNTEWGYSRAIIQENPTGRHDLVPPFVFTTENEFSYLLNPYRITDKELIEGHKRFVEQYGLMCQQYMDDDTVGYRGSWVVNMKYELRPEELKEHRRLKRQQQNS